MDQFSVKQDYISYSFPNLKETNFYVYMYIYVYICSMFGAAALPLGQGLLIHEVSRSHTKTHHSWWESSG